MANNENLCSEAEGLQADEDAFLPLKILPGYSPLNPACTRGTLTARYEAMPATREVELRAHKALNATRDATIAAQWEHHKLILRVKDQVIAQCGADSNELASLRLKKNPRTKSPRPSRQAFRVDRGLACGRHLTDNGGKAAATCPDLCIVHGRCPRLPVAVTSLRQRLGRQSERQRP